MDSTATGVELLERAIGYARGTLAHVTDDLLDRPTPCSDWCLSTLLDHMADALDAFTQASAGLVPLAPPPALGTRVEVLRTKACALLGAWTAIRPTPTSPGSTAVRVQVGEASLGADVLLHAAALEIALHGWDVGQAAGAAVPLPERLAADLTPVAHALIGEDDRGTRFAPPVAPTDPGVGASLLGFCGRAPLESHPLR